MNGGKPMKKGNNLDKPKKAKDIKGTTKRLLKYLNAYKGQLFIAFILIVFSTFSVTYATRLIGVAIDGFIATKDLEGLINVCLKMLGVYTFTSVSTWLQMHIMVYVAQKTVCEIREDIFNKLQKLPLKYFDQTPTGDTMSRITNDVDNISTTLNESISQILSSGLAIVFTFIAMLILSPELTITTVIILPIMYLVVKLVSSKSKKYFTLRQTKLGALNGYIEEVITGQKVVKVFNREEKEIEEFSKTNQDLVHSQVLAEIYSGVIAPVSTALNGLSYCLIATVGGIMLATGMNMTVGIMSTFVTYTRQFTRPINEIATLASSIMAAIAGAERVFEILDEEIELEDEKDAVELKDIEGKVEFNNVNFSYDGKKEILKNINLYANSGETIALVGPTGAGKTTIINLLTRFYDVQSGEIVIDGKPIKKVERNSLRSCLGVVLQDTYLFTGTIEDNLRYGKLNATFEEIKEAAKLANANEFIKKLPDGYKTILTDGGSNLSQGQRQMISIARAILSDPSILVLDEATSSVDTRTEMKIQEAMHNLMKGRTNFVIAHRLSTIKNADLIVVINDGEIIERGNHDRLLEKKGFYYNLYMSQFVA